MQKCFLLLTKLIILFSFFWYTFFTYGNDYENFLNEVAHNRAGDSIVGNWINWFLMSVWQKIILPIIIVIWLLIAFIGFYKLSMSDKEDERKKWLNFVIWWTLGVVLMSSAGFVVNTLFWDTWTSWILWLLPGQDYDPASIAYALYSQILSKFFFLVMYLVVWVLFVILMISVIKYISSWDKEDVVKHTKTIIIWNGIWIILIIFSKNIIEMFYKKIEQWAVSLWQQAPILESKNIWWLYTILNYFLWFLAFVITIFIIYQAFLLLFKPDDDSTYKNLKKYFVYAILWVFIIWWVYIIANFFIIK